MKLETGISGIPHHGAKRGKVTRFTRASRRRLIYTIATCGSALPIFVTLTYAEGWTRDPMEAKRHLDVWWQRVAREQPDVAAIWKLEFQKNGSPHFHLLVYHKASGERPFLPWQWVAQSWAEVTGDTSEAHVKAGTRVEAIRQVSGAMWYAAKYLGKEDASPDPDDSLALGRVWGVLGRRNLPVRTSEFWLTPMEVAAFKHHMANQVASSRSTKEVRAMKLEDGAYADHLWQEGRDFYREELLRDPKRIPGTLINGDPVALFCELQKAANLVEVCPFLDSSKVLESLAGSG